jgi:hypothetical protein
LVRKSLGSKEPCRFKSGACTKASIYFYAMPLNIVDFPVAPECGGSQWSVADEDQLATLVALVMVGRSHMAARVLEGTQDQPPLAPDALRERLRRQLFPAAGPQTFHRDGLLFEIICWIVVQLTAGPDEVVSEPHLSSTSQGLDTIKIAFEPEARNVDRAFIYEQKCTEDARGLFLAQVLPAFKKWVLGVRDNDLLQEAIGLLQRFNLTDEEHRRIYDRLLQDRPLAFHAAITVNPTPFSLPLSVALFTGYTNVTPAIEDRFGDTFPLADIRAWFSAFANRVWQKIEAANV